MISCGLGRRAGLPIQSGYFFFQSSMVFSHAALRLLTFGMPGASARLSSRQPDIHGHPQLI